VNFVKERKKFLLISFSLFTQATSPHRSLLLLLLGGSV